MDYEYDIFLSYSRKHPHGQWVNDVLYPLLIPYVEDALNRKIHVFKDDSEILSGADWERTILSSLLKSRIMVSVLSPSYFMSDWCMKEFQVMHYRQIQLGYMTSSNPSGLIVPITINDGNYFPECVKSIQILDCKNYFRIGVGFMATQRFVELQDKLIRWADDVAHAISISPGWSADWANEDWINNSMNTIDLSTSKPIIHPLL